jgi:hypothetical protein
MSIIVVIVVVVNVRNGMDLQWSPYNIHIRHHQSADVPYPFKTLCHVPF